MKSLIYISSEKIEVIGFAKAGGSQADVAIRDYIACPLPEETVINGKIIEPAYLIECLAGLKRERPELFEKPALAVDGSSIFIKKIVAPGRLSKKRYAGFVRDEFADAAESVEGLVCGYHRLKSDDARTVTMIACATDKAQVESYIETCREAGVKLTAVRVGVEAVLNHVNKTPELWESTFVINVVDGIAMLSMLFQNGTNVLISRSRLYGEGPEQTARVMLENLSGLIQFTRSEKLDDITRACYLGLSDADIAFMNEINPHPDMRIDTLDVSGRAAGAETLPPSARFAVLQTALGDDSIDLIRGYKAMKQEEKKRLRPKRTWLYALIVLVALLAAPAVYLAAQLSGLNEEIQTLESYVTDEATVEKVAELDRLTRETTYYNGVVAQEERKAAWEDSMVEISALALEIVTGNADGIAIGQFTFEEGRGALRVSGRSASFRQFAEYVERLKQYDIIQEITYMGYSSGGGGTYSFSADIELAVKEDTR